MYFAPQGQTKIMNEGWATYWHTSLMTRHILTDADMIDYCDHHSGTVQQQPGRLNPYKMGVELLRNIEQRWDQAASSARTGSRSRIPTSGGTSTTAPGSARRRSSRSGRPTTT